MVLNPVTEYRCDCGGELTVVEEASDSLTVICPACGNSYGFEVAVGDDGTPTYWPTFRIALKGDVSS